MTVQRAAGRNREKPRCILVYAMTTAIASADGAQATLQALMLPLYFASGVFIPSADCRAG
jgi:hypothetical protein